MSQEIQNSIKETEHPRQRRPITYKATLRNPKLAALTKYCSVNNWLLSMLCRESHRDSTT